MAVNEPQAQPPAPDPAAGPAAAAEEPTLRWIEPGEVVARWEPEAARLCVQIGTGEKSADVRAAMAFPVTAPGEYVEFRDAKGEPVGMLRSLDGLEPESRKAVEAALAARYMIPRVTRVLELAERVHFVLHWRVETDRGEREFFTESPREAVKYLSAERIRVTDLAGNHYDLPALAEFDARSRALLEVFL